MTTHSDDLAENGILLFNGAAIRACMIATIEHGLATIEEPCDDLPHGLTEGRIMRKRGMLFVRMVDGTIVNDILEDCHDHESTVIAWRALVDRWNLAMTRAQP